MAVIGDCGQLGAEGRALAVERLLIRTLGPLSNTVLNSLAALSSSQLTALSEALLDFAAPGDLPGF